MSAEKGDSDDWLRCTGLKDFGNADRPVKGNL